MNLEQSSDQNQPQDPVSQPQPVQPEVVASPSEQVPNYLVQSILCTLCCCAPLGIVAIVFAAQVNSKTAAGDIAGAKESSSKAKLFCWIAFGLGLLVALLYGGLMALSMFGAASEMSSY